MPINTGGSINVKVVNEVMDVNIDEVGGISTMGNVPINIEEVGEHNIHRTVLVAIQR